MRSYHSVKAPPIFVLIILLLSVSPLAASYDNPYISQKDALPTQPDTKSIESIKGFQNMGHIDTTDLSASDDEEAAVPSSTASTSDPTESTPGVNKFSELTTLNTTSLGNNSVTSTCSSLQSWYSPNLDMVKEQFITDCYLAVQRLYIDDVHFKAKSNVLIEFVAPPGSNGIPEGFRHTTKLGELVHETPIVYEANTCTLAVIMLSTFANMTGGTSDLPGNFKQVSAMRNTDTTTFRKLHKAGRTVEIDCLRRWGRAGWTVAGDDKDMGVFLWATNSTIDRRIRPAMEEHTGGLIGSGTGSSDQAGQVSPQPNGVSTGSRIGRGGVNAGSLPQLTAPAPAKPSATSTLTAPRRSRGSDTSSGSGKMWRGPRGGLRYLI